MPNAITRNEIIRFLYAGVAEVWKENMKTPEQTYYDKITLKKTSRKMEETYDSVGNLTPAKEKLEGQPIEYGVFSQAHETTIKNKTWSNGFFVTYEAIEDDLYNVIDTAKATEIRRSLMQLKEQSCADMFNGAFTDVGADGKATYAADHPLVNSGSVNDNLASGVLNFDNYVAAVNKFNHIKNHAGGKFDTRPSMLVTHSDLQYKVRQLYESVNVPFETSDTGTKNTAPTLQAQFNPYLTTGATTPWHLIENRINPFIYQEREGMKPDVDQDKKGTKNYYINAMERYNFGKIHPGFGAVGSLGA